MKKYKVTYELPIHPIPDKELWPSTDTPVLTSTTNTISQKRKQRKGRSKKYNNELYEVVDNVRYLRSRQTQIPITQTNNVDNQPTEPLQRRTSTRLKNKRT